MKSRFQETCSIKVTAEAFSLEPGDNIFIQSNILNFGDVPWRVISIKLNNDYTFDLGCVRNPDFIYPYVVPNTPDRVLAPYIPKGAAILPPLTGAQSLLGLTPPVRAPIFGTNNPNTSTNPPRTVTTGTQGGGVGDGFGAINVTGGPEIVNINEINLLRDFVTIETISYSYPIANQAFAEIAFYQPDNAMYESLYIYYKRASASVTNWEFIEVKERPGPGRLTRVRVGPLDTSTGTPVFDLTTRVKYVTGDFSQVINSIQMSPSPGGGISNPIDYQETVSPGWNIPVSGVVQRNDYIAYLTATPLIVSGIRNLSMTMQQDLEFHPINPDIKGIKIFYKQSAAQYWNETEIPFIGYANGDKAPVQLGNLGAPGSAPGYDFIFRIAYKDLTYSTWQVRYMNANVEPSAGVDPFTSASRSVEQTASYSFLTVGQAVDSGTITNPIDMRIGIAGNFVNAAGTGLTTHFLAPDSSVQQFWAGVKVYYRQVIPGSNPAYTSQTFYGITASTLGTLTTYPATVPIQINTEYQYLVVPLVLQSGSIVEGNYGWFGQATVHNISTRLDYPNDGNWIARFNWRQDLVTLLRGDFTSTFPTNAKLPVVTSYTMENANPTQGGAPTVFYFNIGIGGGYGSITTIAEIYRVVVSVQHLGSDFSKLYLFRRHNAGLQGTTNNYYGIGRWEKLTFDTANPNYASGVFTLEIKSPTTYKEYTPNVGFGGNIWSYDRTTYTPDIYHPRKFYTEVSDELYLVVETVSGGVSNQAIRLNGYNGQGSSFATVDLLHASGPPQAVAWPPSDASSYIAGRERNLSEARTYLANSSTSILSLIPEVPQVVFYGGLAQ
jgi:hypothetical protein